jgi:ubiquinone/menaquinone biosynthesis C-methylase UbiE
LERVKKVDYDDRLYQVYSHARALGADAMATWMAAFSRWLPDRRPLTILDMGSGTGRFSPALAETFGGPIYGVEPSDRMREVAEREAAHPAVSYRRGRAEAIPLSDASCDAALLYFVWHHVEDRPAGALELLRVVHPDGVLLIRTNCSDRMPALWWYAHFPRAEAVDREIYEPLAVVQATFQAAGWRWIALEQVTAETAPTRREDFERLQKRGLSTFEHLTEEEIAEGFAAIEAALEADPADAPASATADLLVFARP